jgi:hypothetical protein
MKLVKSKWNRFFVYPAGAPYGLFVCVAWIHATNEWHVWPSWAIEADYRTADADDAVCMAYEIVGLKVNAEHREFAPADCVCNVCVGHIGNSRG